MTSVKQRDVVIIANTIIQCTSCGVCVRVCVCLCVLTDERGNASVVER